MKHPEDISIWNTKRAETKLYQFLNAVSNEFDQEKRDLLRENPLSEVETAYATIRSKRDRMYVMGATKRENEPLNVGSVPRIGSGFSAKLCSEDAATAVGPGYAT